MSITYNPIIKEIILRKHNVYLRTIPKYIDLLSNFDKFVKYVNNGLNDPSHYISSLKDFEDGIYDFGPVSVHIKTDSSILTHLNDKRLLNSLNIRGGYLGAPDIVDKGDFNIPKFYPSAKSILDVVYEVDENVSDPILFTLVIIAAVVISSMFYGPQEGHDIRVHKVVFPLLPFGPSFKLEVIRDLQSQGVLVRPSFIPRTAETYGFSVVTSRVSVPSPKSFFQIGVEFVLGMAFPTTTKQVDAEEKTRVVKNINIITFNISNSTMQLFQIIPIAGQVIQSVLIRSQSSYTPPLKSN